MQRCTIILCCFIMYVRSTHVNSTAALHPLGVSNTKRVRRDRSRFVCPSLLLWLKVNLIGIVVLNTETSFIFSYLSIYIYSCDIPYNLNFYTGFIWHLVWKYIILCINICLKCVIQKYSVLKYLQVIRSEVARGILWIYDKEND